MSDGQGDAHAAGDADVGDDLEASGVQVVGEVDEQAVGFPGQDRPGVHAFARVPFGDFEEVHEHPRACVVQSVAVDVFAVQRGHEREVAAHDAQHLGQGVGSLLGGQDAEVVDDASVGGLREADGQDQGFARESERLGGADNDEGFGGCGVEERGQAGLVGAHGVQRFLDAPRVTVGHGDDGQGALRGFHGVLDDGVDDGAHFGCGRFDGVGTGGGHAGGLDPAGGHGRVGGRPRHGDARVLVAVAGEQQRDLVVEAARAGLDAQGRQDGGQGACRAVLGGDREVVDDD